MFAVHICYVLHGCVYTQWCLYPIADYSAPRNDNKESSIGKWMLLEAMMLYEINQTTS